MFVHSGDSGSASDSGSHSGDTLALPEESLEQDRELELHIMGLHSYYTQHDGCAHGAILYFVTTMVQLIMYQVSVRMLFRSQVH